MKHKFEPAEMQEYLRQFDHRFNIIPVKHCTVQPNGWDCGVHSAIQVYNAVEHQEIDNKKFAQEPYPASVGFRLFMMNTILKVYGSKVKDFVLTASPPGLNKNNSTSAGSQNNPFIITEDIDEASDISDENQNANLPNKNPKTDIAISSKNKKHFYQVKILYQMLKLQASQKSQKSWIGLLIMKTKYTMMIKKTFRKMITYIHPEKAYGSNFQCLVIL